MKIPVLRDSRLPGFRYLVSSCSKVKWFRAWEAKTQRIFSTFPAGPPGVGLLLLRGTLGVVVVVYGVLWASNRWGDLTWLLGLASILCGTLLLIGFATPFAAAAVSMGGALVESIRFFVDGESVAVSVVFAVSAALSIVLLGPGAFSLDSLLFGRRRVVIPTRS